MLQNYRDKYGENPVQAYHVNAYDAGAILLMAIDKVAVKDDKGDTYIGRKALRDALFRDQGNQRYGRPHRVQRARRLRRLRVRGLPVHERGSRDPSVSARTRRRYIPESGLTHRLSDEAESGSSGKRTGGNPAPSSCSWPERDGRSHERRARPDDEPRRPCEPGGAWTALVTEQRTSEAGDKDGRGSSERGNGGSSRGLEAHHLRGRGAVGDAHPHRVRRGGRHDRHPRPRALFRRAVVRQFYVRGS